MRRMGRPRQRHKDLPRGLYKDAAGRFTSRPSPRTIARAWAGKWTVSVGRDATAARIRWAEAFGFRDHEPPAHGTLAELFDRFVTEDLVRTIPAKKRGDPPRPKYAPKTQTDYKARIKRLAKLYGDPEIRPPRG
jgi:hypothetical protein